MLRYAISDRRLFAGDEARQLAALQQQAMSLAKQGVTHFQVREKDLGKGALVACANAVRQVVAQSGSAMRVVLNAAPELAAQAGVGWHTNVAGLRTAGLTDAPVSVSCHTLEDVEEVRGRTDIILFGPVFEKRVHGVQVQPGCGLELLRQAVVAAAGTPVLALGGVTLHNVHACLQTGAAGVASIRMFAAAATGTEAI